MSNQLTEKKLFEMLTENTGKHFLDSGGAYGRDWERNQKYNLKDFKNRSPQSFDFYECHNKLDIVPSIDLFNWLAERLEYEPTMQRAFTRFERTKPEDGWLSIMDEFAELHHDSSVSDFTKPRCINSYNEDCYLSQTIQFTEFENSINHYIALQIHGGCDVRGGYTAPKIFSLPDYEMFYGWCDVWLGCSNCEASWYSYGCSEWETDNADKYLNEYEAVEVDQLILDGSIKDKVQVHKHEASCPVCGQGKLVH
mgnify:CR=1 FL=1